MCETSEQGNAADLSPSGTINANELVGGLKGLTGWVAKKVLKSGIIEKVKELLNSRGAKYVGDALTKLVERTVSESVNAVGLKVKIILTVILGVVAVLATVLTYFLGGNAIIAIIASLAVIVIVWLVVRMIFNSIARKISALILKVIGSQISRFTNGNLMNAQKEEV